MLLADVDIIHALAVNDISIAPWYADMLQAASVEVRLGKELVSYRSSDVPLDPIQLELGPDDVETRVLQPGEVLDLYPGQSILGHTEEIIKLSAQYAARVEGKSTLGREFLQVHSTAGFIDPGFHGQLTLEISNLLQRPIRLTPGMRIAQVGFFRTSQAANLLYGDTVLGSHYQGQMGVTLPKPLRP